MPGPDLPLPATLPGPPAPIVARPGDWEICRQWTAHHSKSFYVSSLLLPRRARADAWALYALCRRADDAVDEAPEPGELAGKGERDGRSTGGDALRIKRQRVATLRARLDGIYGGDAAPEDPIDRAFGEMAFRTRMPRAAPEVLLRGMEMDLEEAHYETWDDLVTYCFRVASIVGLMMVKILGHSAKPAQEPHVLLRAADLGVGMQLTNICRDVGEDARRGRVYLPEALLRAHGTSQAEVLALAQGDAPAPPGLRAAVREILARADAHYAAADRGIPALPWSTRLSIRSARLIYSAIGDRIARQGYDTLHRRAFVPLGAKLWLLLRALGHRGRGPLEAPGPEDAALWGHIQGAGLIPPGLPGPT